MTEGASPAVAVQLVVFHLHGGRYAVELARVGRVLRMVALTPMPRAPAIVLGVFNFHGQLVPAMNVRRRFGLPERAAVPADHLLLLQTTRRRLAFVVDAVEPALAVSPQDLIASDTVVPGLEHVRGIVRLPDEGIVFVHDIDTFLSLDEAQQLDAALAPPPP